MIITIGVMGHTSRSAESKLPQTKTLKLRPADIREIEREKDEPPAKVAIFGKK